jgi:hypothetical protein
MEPTPNQLLYDSYDDNWQKLYFDEESQGFVVAHKEHGDYELPTNFAIAERLAKHFGERIELLPCSFDFKIKSVDATRNGELWEYKVSNGSYASVQNRLRSGATQCPRVLVVLTPQFQTSQVLRGLISCVNLDSKMRIGEINLLTPENLIVQLTRDDIKKRNFEAAFEVLSSN